MIEIKMPEGGKALIELPKVDRVIRAIKALIELPKVDLAIEAYNMGYEDGYKDGVEAYKAMMELEKEEKEEDAEDCISRQEALSHKHIVYDDDGIGYSVVRVDEIKALPSVTPKAEIEKEDPAEWIVNTDETRRWDRVRFYCSSCNGWNTYGKSKYCPNCGRRMQSEKH